ncbi:Peptidyl-tRNA hydrolase [Frankliniella fusca]|uniref:Peptidyl-tRNA hydrolase n=1 Tax=Frankliniella fusca TaxID=407009 RepID=A0AAE1LPJ7_9NEOP|nr:Peptidyl-tRNA hydrolase [Frankliniella fusca]
MSESDYAHECARAELLGLPKPDKDSIPPRPVASEDEELDVTMAEGDQAKVAAEETADLQDEQMKGLKGLDEVHNILSITQKKLNNLKCGIGNVGSSFSSSLSGSLSGVTGFIKQRVGIGEGGASGSDIPEAEEGNVESDALPTAVDKLDASSDRAETAEMRMAAQNKQMRQMLNK